MRKLIVLVCLGALLWLPAIAQSVYHATVSGSVMVSYTDTKGQPQTLTFQTGDLNNEAAVRADLEKQIFDTMNNMTPHVFYRTGRIEYAYSKGGKTNTHGPLHAF